MSLKEKLYGAVGSIGIIIWYILSIAFVSIPIFATELPKIICLILFIIINTTGSIGGVLTVVVYVYAFFVVLNRPLDVTSIVFYVDAAIYIWLLFIPAMVKIISIFIGNHKKEL